MYDVVIVGAGSAGAVLAARASENPDLRVLLLEAGPDYARLADTPGDLRDGNDNSYRAHDWGHHYRPTEGAREQRFPRGRVTGGSSAVNTAIALRGMPEDYDAWGHPDWSWQAVLPAFQRLERDLDFGDAAYHGDAGPIPIRRYRTDELTLPQAAFLETARVLGYPDCPDANDPAGWGSGPHPMNKLGRTRISTAVGYLAPARIRPNLEVRGDALAHRFLLRGSRVVAIEVETRGARERIEGRLFVCAAGAIETPPLLVRSGLGPRSQVESLGIELQADLPGVGANLCDHPALTIVCAAKDPAISARDLPIIQTILRYTAPGSPWRNDLQIEPLTFTAPVEGRASFGIAAVLEQAESRGRLRITSTDPRVPPAIEPRLCSEDADAQRLAGAFLDALAFAHTKPMAELIDLVLFPRPEPPLSLEATRELCRRLAGSGYHPCGTARMGAPTDPDAVVDFSGSVRSIDGLVVADASIMPAVPRANTNLTSIMIGEQIGEWLRTHPARYGL